ncbi:MAG TPA: GNVR domain-containing protein [Terriglobales bacterium]|nr:GNVR domain-containing protein [Terriglobales bacterium]
MAATGMTSPLNWYEQTTRLLTLARESSRMLIGFGLLGTGAAAVTVILLPSYYRSGAAFQAESVAPPALSGSLAGLASQIGGLQLGTSQSSPQLFGDLLTTDAVLRPVANASFPWRGGKATLTQVYGFDREDPDWRDYKTVRKLRKTIEVDVNIRTGVVRFSVEARTPELAKALAETTLSALNEANVGLRQARAAAEQAFTAGRAQASRSDLAVAESALAKFYERNRIANSPLLQLEESRLRRAVDMAQQVYVQLRLQEEQAAVQAVRNTPAITVIDPPLLPVKRSWPNRALGVAAGMLIGLTLAVLRLTISRQLAFWS